MLAGRRQAAVCLVGGDIQLTPLHKRCPTWLLRADTERLERVASPTDIGMGDNVVAGTTVVGVRGRDAF